MTYWLTVFASGVLIAIVVFFAIYSAPLPRIATLIVGVPVGLAIFALTLFVCAAFQYGVARLVVWRRATLQRYGFICTACGARLDDDEFGVPTVIHTGRCPRCDTVIARDAPPRLDADPELPSPFSDTIDEPGRLLRAYAGECKFSHSNATIELVSEPLGALQLPTGDVVACDPLYVSETKSIAGLVPAGDYCVDLMLARITQQAIVLDERIACARLLVRDEPADRFEFVCSYGVDNATGCFMDEVAAASLRSKNEEQFQAFWNEMRSCEERVYAPTRSWGSIVLDVASGANIVFFTSGMGDGGYATYVGRNKTGEVVSLVTDFGLLYTEQDRRAAAQRSWWQR